MILDDEKGLLDRLVVLKREHRELDDTLTGMSGHAAGTNQLYLQRLKKQKLKLRDEIAMIEDELYPDIIA